MFAAVFLIADQSFGEIIPANRRIDWTPGTVTGVIGGIPGSPGGPPARTTIYKNIVTDSGADNTGVSDCTGIIASAINGCPPGQVIYLPAGRYRMNSRIVNSTKNNYTIRGAGQGVTTIMAWTGGSEPFHIGTTANTVRNAATNPITAGATKGSSVVTCDTSDIVAGRFVRIEQPNLSWVKSLTGDSRSLTVVFRVVSKTGTTVTLDHPLPISFTNNPTITPTYPNILQGIGFEDLTIDLIHSTAFAAIYLSSVHGSWVKNVEIKNAYSRQIYMIEVTNLEIRNCWVHGMRGGGPNHEGIDFAQGGCWNLVEDNILGPRGGYSPIDLGDGKGGCWGNVIAYNYVFDVETGNGISGSSITDNHGSFNGMNLIEGNVGQAFQSDGYKGGSGYGTLLRNSFSGKYTGPDTSVAKAIALKHFANYYNIVGNVLGDPSLTQRYDIEVSGYNSSIKLIYQLGYPNSGNVGWQGGSIAVTSPPNYTDEPSPITIQPQRFDPNVKNTIIRHGNFDYATQNGDGSPRTPGIVWEADDARGTGVGFADHTIPNSYYLGARPSWWPTAVSWPPIGPDKTPMVGVIPAQARFQALIAGAPGRPVNLRISPSPTPTATPP